MDIEQLPEWDNYGDSDNGGTEPDGIERPPLTGKNRYIPEGLYEQPWDHVGDAYGKATLTPYYIEALTSDDDGDVNFGAYWLYAATTHQGSVYKASGMAIPFLADILHLNNDASELACHFLARIALGENHFIPTPAYFYKTKYFREVQKYQNDVFAYYEKTASPGAMRLLCFLPDALPDYIDISYAGALEKENGDEKRAFVRQASALIVQGFLASKRNYPGKEYPSCAQQIDLAELQVCNHIVETRKLMEESPSLLVRGCSAICLAFTGIVDIEIMELLAFLGEQNPARAPEDSSEDSPGDAPEDSSGETHDRRRSLCGVPWVWGDDFSSIAKKAWIFAADLDMLAETDCFPTLEYTSETVDGVKTEHYSHSEILAEAAFRAFPAKYTRKKEELPSLLPSELSEIQKKILQRMLASAPGLFGNYMIEGLNLPQTVEGAGRWLGESSETLCIEFDGKPLWAWLEQSVLKNTAETALGFMAQLDVWMVLDEIYKTYSVHAGKRERCTLNIRHYNDKKAAEREVALESILATALSGCIEHIEQAQLFLERQLEATSNFAADSSDWSSGAPAQRIGVCLLALARAGKLEEKYYPLVRPYHSYAEYSDFPLASLKEVLEHTSAEHQQKVKEQFRIK